LFSPGSFHLITNPWKVNAYVSEFRFQSKNGNRIAIGDDDLSFDRLLATIKVRENDYPHSGHEDRAYLRLVHFLWHAR
jgi:hypothetical protein